MSGGVDSGVAALLLRDAGYRVHAVFLRMWPGDDPRSCCSPAAEARAADLADHLDLPFHVFDLREEFEARVVTPFVAEYLAGATPNPCVVCNRFRFTRLIEWARERGLRHVASGHYARLTHDAQGPWLVRGRDAGKDQSYMLARLSAAHLASLILPLGELTKRQVRHLARGAGLPSAEAAESQEVCFAVNGYKAFLRSRGVAPHAGRITDESGADVGRHSGHWQFTVGQRRGLGIGGGAALYVLERRADRNEVVVGPRSRLTTSVVEADGLDGRALAALEEILGRASPGRPTGVAGRGRQTAAEHRGLAVQLRYRSPAVAITAADAVGDRRVRLTLARPFSAAAPGQAAVFYRDDRVVGSGRIAMPSHGTAVGGVIPFEGRSSETDDTSRTHGGQTC